MKRKNNKLLTLMLAGVLCAATAGAVAATAPVNASADTSAKSYELTKIFNSNGTSATIAGKEGKTALTMANGQSVEFNRNLAIEWFTAKNTAAYTTLKFTFEDVNFTEMTFVFETVALHAAKDDVAVNKVSFVKDSESGKVFVKVLNGDQKSEDVTGVETAIVAGSNVTLSLGKGAELGNYTVNLAVADGAATAIGEFTNVGVKYFFNGSKNGEDLQALVVETKAEADAKTVLIIDEINGQLFNNITDNKVKDTAAPVLVVNDDVCGFLLGTQFELDYKEIDVLDDTLTTTKSFYQYNPADEKVALADNKIDFASSLTPNSTTGTYFMDTVIYTDGTSYSKEAKDGFTKTTVYRTLGAEYVAIRFTVADDTWTGTGEDTHLKTSYDLSWYADAEFVKEWTLGETATDYIVLNRTEEGPKYSTYTADDITEYEKKLQAKADKVAAGSNASVEFPSLAWLINDENNGYQTLQFTISYKTPGSSSAKTTSNVDPKNLKISVDQAGWYEFKVFASDAAGNAMMVEDEDGELVKVTTSNIWDLDNIPSFKFKVDSKGIETDSGEDSDTLDTQLLGETYTMSTVDIVGAVDEQSDYSLYMLDISKYAGSGTLTTEVLSGIKFAALQTEVKALVNAELAKDGVDATTIDFMALSKQAYINLVAKAISGEAEKVAEIFTEINAYDDRITEDMESAWAESDNKYNWNPSSRSFKTVDSGLYLIIADYWDADTLEPAHATAYQLVEVESEADVIKGETEWLKKNLVSVILFSVAAVMLILIIILLLVKPSDETLEDVDEKIVSKRKEATDKHKKN